MSELSPRQRDLLGFTQALLKPKPRLTGSEWADKYFYLSPESSAVSGKWTTKAYQREPLDCMTDDGETQQVTWWKSARVGYTKCINIAVAYHIHQNPASILLAQPTEDEAIGYAEDEIEPMIRDNPVISNLINQSSKKGRYKKEKTTKKRYAGGVLELVGALSPRNFRRRTVRIFIGDEIDGWEQQAGKDGDQISLGKKRNSDFWNKKTILGSSPTTEELTKIKAEFLKGDQRYYHVDCPHCGHHHKLEFKHLTWNKDKEGELIEDSVGFECPSCGVVIDESYKEDMIDNGEWIATKPFKGHASFFIWAAYNYSWVEIVKEWLEAQNNPLKLKAFTNLVLGETWVEDQGEKIEDDELLQRREDYTLIPSEAVVLTCGVDTQDDRLEGEIKAWGDGDESWGVLPFRIEGVPAQKKVWDDLDAIINSTYQREDGVELRVSCTCVDSGGHFTDAVYKYCKKREYKRVFAIRGANTAGKPLVSRPSTSNKGKVKLFTVGTDTAKELIFARLKLEEFGEGYMHYNKKFDGEYFKQLTSEKLITTYSRGRPIRAWKPTRARNEALDYNVYNLVALAILNPNYKIIQENISTPQEDKIKKPKKKIKKRGGWANGWR